MHHHQWKYTFTEGLGKDDTLSMRSDVSKYVSQWMLTQLDTKLSSLTCPLHEPLGV